MTQLYVCEKEFNILISNRSNLLYNYCQFIAEHEAPEKIMNRPFLGVTLSQSAELEELLDSYGAANNRKWSKFRSLVATIKRFSDVSYELLHIRYGIPGYKLLDVGGNFPAHTEEIVNFTRKIVRKAAANFVSQCSLLELDFEYEGLNQKCLTEKLPEGMLPHDHATKQITDACKIVATLSASFLNMAADTTLKNIIKAEKPFDYTSYENSSISEKNLRTLELKFHNLQSLYDTFVSKTNTENIDKELPTLRGHISVVFHILSIATSLSHYYERHLCNISDPDDTFKQQMVRPVTLLSYLTDYCIDYMERYVESAKKLCQGMLKRYAKIIEVAVPVPRYKGFHVRPSTLVAMIAAHYGSALEMTIDGQKYNAAITLELFRANQTINANKLNSLCRDILQLDEIKKFKTGDDVRKTVYNILLKLADMGKIVIYEQPLNISECCNRSDITIIETVRSEIASLQAIGKIDIVTDLKAKFKGDERVLEDIKLLAHFGYGEDNHGNNIPLPPRLGYLRK